ncbi:cilia- and flagella-associated protein 57-like isoform X2 [Paramacrobiotus metropolitanus]|nr:cilia- and flagella-associated protein 57-like isoform X2 [Paramacrobiotus metropolitanus]
MAVAQGQYLAYAESAVPFAALVVYDLATFRKKRTMVTNEINSTTWTAIDFDDSGKQVVGLGGSPYNLVYWWWEKTRLLGTTIIGQEMRQIKIAPGNPNRIAMCAPGIIRVYKLEENQFKLEPKSSAKINEFFEFITLVWISELRMLLGTQKGQVIIWEDGNLVKDVMDPTALLSLHTLKLSKKSDMSIPVDKIVAHPSGFVCTYGAGLLKNYEAAANGGYAFHKDIKIMVEDKSLEYGIVDEQQIVDLAISPAKDVVCVVTDKRQIFSAKLRDLRRSKEEFYRMKPLLYFLHSGAVTGVDICVRKPLVASCSADRSVRIWNFYNRDCEIWKKFPEEPHSIALHPSGLYLLAGFTDKLKLMHILNDDIKTVRDLSIRGCKEVKFCRGGHLFAAANGSIVQIYGTVQFDNVANLKGHTARIRCILWAHDDIHLFTTSQDGSLFEWDMLRGEIIHEVTLRGTIFTSLFATADGATVFGVTAEGIVKEIVNGHVTRDIKCPNMVLTSVSMSRAGHCVLLGTTEGLLKALSYPLPADENAELVWLDTPAHQSEITKTMVSYDDQLLITAGADGSVFVWKVVEGEIARILRRDKPSPYSDELLIERKELDLKNAHILELTTKAEEIQLEHEYQKRAKDSVFNEKIKDLTESFTKDIEMLKSKNERLVQEKDQNDQQHQQDMAVLIAKFNHDLLEQERITNQKLLLEYEKYAELILEKEKQEVDFKDQLQDITAAKEDAIERLTIHYENKIESLHGILERTQKEFGDAQREHDELRHLMEEDADMEIVDIRARYEAAIFELKDTNMRLKGENGVMKKKINNLVKDIDDHKAEVMKYQADLTKQQNVSKGLEKEIESWKKELKEREENIQDKEKRIHELKKKNQELEKFKFVLDFKIKELRKQIEPKDDEILEQSRNIKELEEKMAEQDDKLQDLKGTIHSKNNALEQTRKERDETKLKLKEQETFVRRFQGDMELATEFISNPTKLRETFLRIVDRYVRLGGKTTKSVASDDSTRAQRLEREVSELKGAISDTKALYQRKLEVLSRKLWKMMQQNTSLIEEINMFRQEVTALRTRLQLLDTAVQGANPRAKTDFAKIQSLLKEIETLRIEDLEKDGTLELYRQELRRLHLLFILMRAVVNNDHSPGVQELVERLQDVKLPPVVGPSKIDAVAQMVTDKIRARVVDACTTPLPLRTSVVPEIKTQPPAPVRETVEAEGRKRVFFPPTLATDLVVPPTTAAVAKVLHVDTVQNESIEPKAFSETETVATVKMDTADAVEATATVNQASAIDTSVEAPVANEPHQVAATDTPGNNTPA